MLAELQRMRSTPQFLSNYFKSNNGKHFLKENPQKPPSDEFLLRVQQRKSGSAAGAEHSSTATKKELEDI
jgi:hypothetical protein